MREGVAGQSLLQKIMRLKPVAYPPVQDLRTAQHIGRLADDLILQNRVCAAHGAIPSVVAIKHDT